MRPGVCLLRAGNRTRRPAPTHHGNHARGVQRARRTRSTRQSATTSGRPSWSVADQRRHQRRRLAGRGRGSARLGYGQGDIAVEASVGTAFQARPNQMKDAPVFIPHTRPERGPLWFAEPRTALLSAVPDPATPAAARGIVEGVLFADRMIIESCIGAQQRTLYASGAFGYEPELPQLLADALDRDILVVDESHLLPSALQQCASTSSRARRCRHRRLASCARVQNGGTSSRHAGSTTGRSGRR